MKTKILFALAVCGLASLAGAADPMTTEQLVALAIRDPKHAALIIEYGIEDNPRLALEVVEAVVKALPDQAVAIVTGLIKAVPKQQTEKQTPQQKELQTQKQADILRTAIRAQPALALQFTEAALTLFPDRAAVLLRVASEAAPENVRGDLAAVGRKVAAATADQAKAEQPAAGEKPAGDKPAFPPQPLPVSGGITSPSS